MNVYICVEQEALEEIHVYNCVEWEALEHTNVYIFVEWETLKHMSYENLCVEHESSEAHEKIKLEVLGISPRAFQVDVEHKLWNIRSLAIISLGVS